MTTETQITCSLSADELPKRLAEMTALGKDALLGVSPEGVMRFRADNDTRERLEGIVAAESQCCSFLQLGLTEKADALVLSVTAPEGAEPLAWDLVNAFAADAGVA